MAALLHGRWHLTALAAEAALGLAVPMAHARNADDGSGMPATGPTRDRDAGDRAAIALAAAATRQAPGDRPEPAKVAKLILAVTLNGQDRGLVDVQESHDRLWVSLAAIRKLGVVPPPGLFDPLPLDALPGALVHYQASDQSLELVVPVALLDVGQTRANLGVAAAPRAQSSPGAVFNYDVQANLDHGGVALGAVMDLRAFAGASSFESTQSFTLAARQRGQSTRFDTVFTLSLPDRRLTLRLGDTLTSTTAWSRATRIGGVQIGNDFSLQPYLITVPIPAFFGSSVLPSSADVYINGLRSFSGSVPPGPFQIGVGPARIDGAGNAQLVLTNMLGQVSRISLPIYETPLALRRGLSDWSVEAGAIRLDYGRSSFSYARNPVASASWRSGLTDTVTVALHGEAGQGVVNIGLGGVWVLGQAGVLSGSVAQSRSGSVRGGQYAIGYTLAAGHFHLAASVQRASAGYADLGSSVGQPGPRVFDTVQVGWYDRVLGNIGVNYLNQRAAGQDGARYAGVSWTKSLGRDLSLNLAGNQNLARHRDRSVLLTLSFNFTRGHHASLGTGIDHRAAVVDATLQSTPALAGGFGYKLALRRDGNGAAGDAELERLGAAGDIRLGVASGPGQVDGFLAYNGSLAIMDGQVFAGRRINTSFAVISTEGVAHVPVTFQDRAIGMTNRNGRLLVADLNPWQHNELGIDPADLPAGYQFSTLHLDATPTWHGGIAVRFPIHAFSAVTLTLITPSGELVAAGTPTAMTGSDTLAVGFDGQLYIENPLPGARVVVGAVDQPCHFNLPATIAKGDILRLGRIVCEAGP